MNEAKLIERSRQGDVEAFGQLIRQYEDKMFNLARKVCSRAPDEADGIYQDTWVTALEKIGQFENRSGLGTWLYRIAANLCWMRLRSKNRQKTLSLQEEGLGHTLKDETPGPALQAKQRELAETVQRAMESLSLEDRMVVTLRDLQGKTTEETARILNLSVQAVKSRLHRSRFALRGKLRPLMGEAGLP